MGWNDTGYAMNCGCGSPTALWGPATFRMGGGSGAPGENFQCGCRGYKQVILPVNTRVTRFSSFLAGLRLNTLRISILKKDTGHSITSLWNWNNLRALWIRSRADPIAASAVTVTSPRPEVHLANDLVISVDTTFVSCINFILPL